MKSPLIVMASGPDYEGFVVIDSLFHERSSGGVRIAPDMTLDEVRDLAREMTLKYSLFRLTRGGAKAGLRMVEGLDAASRGDALRDFGRQIGPLVRAGLYSPGTDMNCGFEELQKIYEGVGHPIGPTTDTSFYTAVGLADAILGSSEALGLSAPATLAIEGYGSVANHLAGMLPPAEFRITAISTVRGAVANPEGFPVVDLQRLRAAHGDDLVHHLPGTSLPREELLLHAVDILVPAARTGTITLAVAAQLQARAIIPAANAPFRPGTTHLLRDRGVLCLPGYLCNAGGVFGSSLADNGVPLEVIKAVFRTRFRPLVRALVTRSREQQISPVALVDEVATCEAELRTRKAPTPPLTTKLWDRMKRRLPRATRRRAAMRLCREAFDAMDRAFRREPA